LKIFSHSKLFPLDIPGWHAPFPSIFIVYEMRVRGYHPFQTINPTKMPDSDVITWQDWVLDNGVFNMTGAIFVMMGRQSTVTIRFLLTLPQWQRPMMMSEGGLSSGTLGLEPLTSSEKVITDILAVTHAMSSWKACELEGTSWTGTAEENIEKSRSIQDP
jgi:hypothetical protein